MYYLVKIEKYDTMHIENTKNIQLFLSLRLYIWTTYEKISYTS